MNTEMTHFFQYSVQGREVLCGSYGTKEVLSQKCLPLASKAFRKGCILSLSKEQLMEPHIEQGKGTEGTKQRGKWEWEVNKL